MVSGPLPVLSAPGAVFLLLGIVNKIFCYFGTICEWIFCALCVILYTKGVFVMLSERQKKNYDFFSENLPEWLKDNLKVNKFAVIHSEELAGLFDSFEAAFRFACTNFSENDFIIQQIIDQSEIVEFLRSAVV